MKREVQSPLWPEPNPELEAAIGRALISWSVLDREIDNALELVLRIDHELAHCVAANLGTKARLDIFRASVHSLWHSEHEQEISDPTSRYARAMRSWIDSENAWIAQADCLAGDTERMAGEFRNWMAHGQIFLLHLKEDERHLMWGKLSARKGGVKGRFSKLHPEAFDKATLEVRELVGRWHLLRQELACKVDLLDEVDRESA